MPKLPIKEAALLRRIKQLEASVKRLNALHKPCLGAYWVETHEKDPTEKDPEALRTGQSG